MPRGKSAKSNQSIGTDADMEVFEAELEKLQRTYRIMENDKQAYTLESQDIIRRHLSEIDTLKKEREELLKNLNLAESKRNQEQDRIHVTELQRLLEENDGCLHAIEQEKELHAKLEAEVLKWEEKVKEQRRSVGSMEARKSFAQRTQKRMNVLEGRLHRALSKFNTALTKNAALRDEIETLRIEKGKFQSQYKKYEKVLEDLKKEIGQIVEASTLAYDQRDEAHSKIFLLKEKSDKDLQLYNAEIKEQQRVIDHDKILRYFMISKSFARPGQIPPAKRSKELKKKGDGRLSIESFEEAFREIEEITGTNDIDMIVRDFITVEDSNFALFNYVNEQNNEIERLHDIIDGIQQKISEFRNEGSKMDFDRKEILDDLEYRRESAAVKCAENEELLATALKILEQLKLGIGSIFRKIGCDSGALEDLLGGSEGVKDDNMMQYLGLIEQRANELLAAQTYLDSQDFEKSYDPTETARIILGQVPVTPVQQLLIAPPSTGDLRLRAQRNKLLASVLQIKDEYDSDDLETRAEEESRPLTQKELKDRIMKGVLKKESAASKKGFRYDLSTVKRNR